MKVDLTLLVPSWVLQYDTWREFLEVLEQSINEIVENVDDLRELYDIEKAKEFVVLLARNFGFKELVYQDIEKNVQLLDNQFGFIQWKGSEEFFKWLSQLFEVSVVFRDLSKEVLMWSGGRGWDMHVIQDAKYYRDGSVEVTVSVMQYWGMKELERFVSAGVYVWYMVISGLQMFEVESRLRAWADIFEAEKLGVEGGLSYVSLVDVVGREQVDFGIYAKTTGFYMVLSDDVVVLSDVRMVPNMYVVVLSDVRMVLNNYAVILS